MLRNNGSTTCCPSMGSSMNSGSRSFAQILHQLAQSRDHGAVATDYALSYQRAKKFCMECYPKSDPVAK